MNILVYDPCFTGHHPEYINNLWEYFNHYSPIDKKIYFAIHQKTINLLNITKNNTNNNIAVIELQTTDSPNFFNKYTYQFCEVQKIVKEYDISHVVLLMLNSLFVGLAFANYKFNVSGILFAPFDPMDSSCSFLKRITKRFLYAIISKQTNIKKLFILNDKDSCVSLNEYFHTDKYHYLPDPIPFYIEEKLPSIITDIKITRKIILHIGSMSQRKGTNIILDAIPLLPAEVLSQIAFFFIGKPSDLRFEQFMQNKIIQLQKDYPDSSIYCDFQYISNGQMESYYEISDIVLIPYLSNNMSSGILGHAAKHGKPVITGRGLLEKIVSDYCLGSCIDVNAENIKNTILIFLLEKFRNNEKQLEFLETHTVALFAQKLLSV
jgi:glycosyltransferase involved in cell wall biosynthesis